ncbi:MAG: ArsR family transcriptional regulator [Candidatus Odinarchaeia archaeon]
MDEVELEIAKLRNKINMLEELSFDVKSLKVQLEKLNTSILQIQSKTLNEPITLPLDKESIKNQALENMMFDAFKASRNIKKGLIFLIHSTYEHNNALIKYTQVYEHNGKILSSINSEDMKELSNFLQALGSKERIKILSLLEEGDKSVKEIKAEVGRDGGALYHHINALVENKLITKRGNNYTLTHRGREIIIMLGLISQQSKFSKISDEVENAKFSLK